MVHSHGILFTNPRYMFICSPKAATIKNQGKIQILFTIFQPHLMAAPSALNSKLTVISPLNGANPLTEVTALVWNHFEKFDSMAGVRIKNRLAVCLI